MLSWLHASPHRCCLFFEKALLLSFPKAIVISHSVLAGCMEKREGPKSQRSCDKKCLSVLSNPPLCNVCLHKPPVHSNNTTIFFFFFFSITPARVWISVCKHVRASEHVWFFSQSFSRDYNPDVDFEKKVMSSLLIGLKRQMRLEKWFI